MDTLTTSLEEVGGQYILPFEFMDDGRGRTSHYVIFVTKRFRGYDIMKENMISLSSDTGDVRRLRFAQQGELFTEEFGAYSINDLKERLVESWKGKASSVEQIYEVSTVRTPYTSKNVKDALIALEEEGRVSVDVPASRRPKRLGRTTMGEKRIVTFPD